VTSALYSATDLMNVTLQLLHALNDPRKSDRERQDSYKDLTQTVTLAAKMYPEAEEDLHAFLRSATRLLAKAKSLPARPF